MHSRSIKLPRHKGSKWRTRDGFNINFVVVIISTIFNMDDQFNVLVRRRASSRDLCSSCLCHWLVTLVKLLKASPSKALCRPITESIIGRCKRLTFSPGQYQRRASVTGKETEWAFSGQTDGSVHSFKRFQETHARTYTCCVTEQ